VFDQAAVDAARQWHITPARAANGVPFERRVRTAVEFRARRRAEGPSNQSVSSGSVR
jgi:outer membrane biosynthesis protein TonB